MRTIQITLRNGIQCNMQTEEDFASYCTKLFAMSYNIHITTDGSPGLAFPTDEIVFVKEVE